MGIGEDGAEDLAKAAAKTGLFDPLKDLFRDAAKEGGEDAEKAAEKSLAKLGSIDETEKAFNNQERKIAELLESEGKDVKALRESDVPGVRTADSLVDGQPTEFKSLDPGAGNTTVKNALNSAQGQASQAIIDARGSGLGQSEAERGLKRYLGASRGRMSFIRIVGDGWEIISDGSSIVSP
jgi:hypothetical protein